MRFLLILVALLAGPALRAEEPSGISEFSKRVAEAVQKRDTSSLRQLSWEVDVPQTIHDQTLATWTQLLSGDYPEKGWAFKNVEFLPLETFKSWSVNEDRKKSLSEEALEAIRRGEQQSREIYANMTKPFLQDGQLHEYNLKVIGFLVLNFTNGQAVSGRMMPLGIAPARGICFALLKETKSEP